MEESGIFTTMVIEKEERPSGAKTWDDSIAALPAAALICCIFSSAFSTTFALRLPLAHDSFHLFSSLRLTHFHDMYPLCTALMSI